MRENYREREKKSSGERDFLLGLSHDLRSPGNSALFSLRNIICDLASGESFDQQLESLLHIEKALEEQQSMLGDSLDLLRQKEGLLDPQTRVFELKTILLPLLDRFSHFAKKKGLSFKVEKIPDVCVEFDTQHLLRIVSNLLSNALKYTDSGGISVEFIREAFQIEISICDSGRGVPAGEVDKLFRGFSRLSNVDTCPGYGLGLLVAKNLAELNRGYLVHRSNPKGGAIFSVGIKSKNEEKQHLARKKIKVLILEDDPETCQIYKRYLLQISSEILTFLRSGIGTRNGLAKRSPI